MSAYKKSLSLSWLRYLGIAVLVFCVRPVFCQDVIFTIKGSEIKCKVQEIGEDSVSYKDVGAQIGAAAKFIVKKEVNKIKYANGYEDVFNPLVANAAVSTAVKEKASVIAAPAATTITANAAGDMIFTLDGKQLACKVTDIDDNIITYLVAGNTAPQKIDSKTISYIRYSNGTEEAYNKPSDKKIIITDTNVAKKVNTVVDDRKAMALALQNWRRKYVAPALEIF